MLVFAGSTDTYPLGIGTGGDKMLLWWWCHRKDIQLYIIEVRTTTTHRSVLDAIPDSVASRFCPGWHVEVPCEERIAR